MENLVTICQEAAVEAMESFLKTFSFVPDDRLTWKPCPTANSAIRIAAHTALYVDRFAIMLRNRRLPIEEEIPGIQAVMNAAEEALTDRQEMERVYRRNTEEFVRVIASLTTAETGSMLDSTFCYPVPMTFLMWLPSRNALGHEGQIDYLQTCWDDKVVHF